jgi:hypothetical protein
MVSPSTKRRAVKAVVEAAMARYGVPEPLRSDNGPEFIA